MYVVLPSHDVIPSPEYPPMHLQVYVPYESSHIALGWHGGEHVSITEIIKKDIHVL